MSTIKEAIKAIPIAKICVSKLRSAYWSHIVHNEQAQPEALKRWHKRTTGENLNLDNPKTYTEKMQWSKLYDRDPIKTKLADKYAVREFIAERIGEEYLIPLLGVWKDAKDIDFDALPEKFVLKCTHGSGWNVIVRDKSKLNIPKTRRKLNQWLKLNFGYLPGLELHYIDIPPRIVAEEYLENNINGGGQLTDYKFYCFDGEPKLILVAIDRETDKRYNYYDTDWTLLPFNVATNKNSDHMIHSPVGLEHMMTLSRALAKGFPHVRVDLYNVDSKIYFGEMTFTSGNGVDIFTPHKYNRVVGDMWKLPVV